MWRLKYKTLCCDQSQIRYLGAFERLFRRRDVNHDSPFFCVRRMGNGIDKLLAVREHL
jgi:hypothetical protein